MVLYHHFPANSGPFLCVRGLHTLGTDDESYQILAVLSEEPLTNNFKEDIEIRLLTKSSCAGVLARNMLAYHPSATSERFVSWTGQNAHLRTLDIEDFDCLQQLRDVISKIQMKKQTLSHEPLIRYFWRPVS
jgi:hypothetical protein